MQPQTAARERSLERGRSALVRRSDHAVDMPEHESDTERLARYEHALQRLAIGALSPTMTAHPLTAIGRIAARLLEGAELDEVLREIDREGRVSP